MPLAPSNYRVAVSSCGYEAKFRRTLRDGELGAGSGPSNRNVGFVTDSVGSTPESRLGASGRLSSDLDPKPTLARYRNLTTGNDRRVGFGM